MDCDGDNDDELMQTSLFLPLFRLSFIGFIVIISISQNFPHRILKRLLAEGKMVKGGREEKREGGEIRSHIEPSLSDITTESISTFYEFNDEDDAVGCRVQAVGDRLEAARYSFVDNRLQAVGSQQQ